MNRNSLANTAGAIHLAAKAVEGRPAILANETAPMDRRVLEDQVWAAMPAGHKSLTGGERHILHTDPATGATALQAIKTLSPEQLQAYLAEAAAKEAAEIDAKTPSTGDAPNTAAKEQIPVVWAGKDALAGPGVALSADGSAGVAWAPAAGGRMAVKMFQARPGLYASLDVVQRATVGFQTRTGDAELRRLDASDNLQDQAALHLKVFSVLGDSVLGRERVDVVEASKVSVWAEKGFDPYAELEVSKKPAVIEKVGKDAPEKLYEAKEVDQAWLEKHKDTHKLALWCLTMEEARAQVKNLEMRRADRAPLPDTWVAPAPVAEGDATKKGEAENGAKTQAPTPPEGGSGPFVEAGLSAGETKASSRMASYLVKCLADLNEPLVGKNGTTKEGLDSFLASQRLRFLAMDKAELENLVRANSLWAGYVKLSARLRRGVKADGEDIFKLSADAQLEFFPVVQEALKAAGLDLEMERSGGWMVYPSAPLPMLYATPWWEGEDGKLAVQVSDFGDGDLVPFKTIEEVKADPQGAAADYVGRIKAILANSEVIPGEGDESPRVKFRAAAAGSVEEMYDSSEFQDLMVDHPFPGDKVNAGGKETEEAITWVLDNYEKHLGRKLSDQERTALHDKAHGGFT